MMREREAFTFIEMMVVVGLFTIVTGVVWAATSVTTRQSRQLEGFNGGAQAALLARAVLGRDLEELVVLPGHAAAQVAAAGTALHFLTAASPGAHPTGVRTARVSYDVRPAPPPLGGVVLYRNGRPVTEVPFARVTFATSAAGSRHQVTARLELTLDGGGAAMTGRTAVVLVEHSYGLPETYPGLKTFIAGR